MTAKLNKMLTNRYEGDTILVSDEEEVRCPACNHLIFKGKIQKGAIEIKCPKRQCRKMFKFKAM